MLNTARIQVGVPDRIQPYAQLTFGFSLNALSFALHFDWRKRLAEHARASISQEATVALSTTTQTGALALHSIYTRVHRSIRFRRESLLT